MRISKITWNDSVQVLRENLDGLRRSTLKKSRTMYKHSASLFVDLLRQWTTVANKYDLSVLLPVPEARNNAERTLSRSSNCTDQENINRVYQEIHSENLTSNKPSSKHFQDHARLSAAQIEWKRSYTADFEERLDLLIMRREGPRVVSIRKDVQEGHKIG